MPPWQDVAGYRVRPVVQPPGKRPGFTLLTPAQSGLNFTNVLTPGRAAENQIRLNGSGVALGDADGDGWCDIYLCGLENENALYRNLGNGRFTNITASAGVGCGGQYSSGAVFADVDGDGDLDLLVNGVGTGTRLFLNGGGAVFTEAAEAGLVRTYGATTAALADTDGDGDLDLYVANYRTTTVRSTGFVVLNVGGRRMIRPQDRERLELTPEGRVLEHGEPHFFYRNDGGGRFSIVPWTDGSFVDEDGRPLAGAPRDWGLSAMFRDLNGDGAPDLYVCNDFHSNDKIWINDGRGRFRLIDRLAIRNSATFSMAADFADVNRDGHDDILVSDMMSRQHGRRLMQDAGMDPYSVRLGVFDDRQQFDRTVLQLNRGDGTYAEMAYY
ncbi:MAG TPA: VCBS repeat-containing protein, partial [Candidatus Paceibacterota bacterium]|nr:VCBS repeat-containing protein [Candidatus Paceibacterota bacterium]